MWTYFINIIYLISFFDSNWFVSHSNGQIWRQGNGRHFINNIMCTFITDCSGHCHSYVHDMWAQARSLTTYQTSPPVVSEFAFLRLYYCMKNIKYSVKIFLSLSDQCTSVYKWPTKDTASDG